jgi:predicted MPP superfamily phosphohydrolase
LAACHVTWLHISDAHFGAPDMAGELNSVIAMLLDDLQRLRVERELAPDFLFFTGDIAFGELPGSRLTDQYQAALELLCKLEELCAIPRSHMFLVPGNHDVNRTRVDKAQTGWLDSLLQGEADATLAVDQLWAKADDVSRERYLERLENYAGFLQRAKLTHLLEDRSRLVYTHCRQVRGVQVAITGLNTAWSSCRDREKGKLWLGQAQVRTSAHQVRNADLSIALGHHPPGWFNEYEDPGWYETITTHYDFYLHGHEHNNWVEEHAGHVRVAAGALYERRLTATGYNFVRVDFEQPSAEVFLRQYDARGGGWIPRCIYRKTDDSGRWPLGFCPEAPSRKPRPPEPGPAPRPLPLPPDVFEYFSVASAVSDESRFIGRRSELRTALGALRARGAAIAIYGLAGVGKTSLALQIARIATGADTKLCAAPALATCLPAGGFRHQVIYYSCRQSIDVDLETTLRSILQDRIGEYHIGRLLTLDGFRDACQQAGIAPLMDSFHGGSQSASPSALSVFRSLGSLAHDFLGKREIVVILDEFNVVGDKRGFATLIKELPQVKFVMVGTAVDVRMLVQDHASIPRQLAEGQIRLRPMSSEELVDLISNEEARSRSAFSFSAQAKRYVASAARGMPFFAHFLGRYSLEAASRDTTRHNGVKVELSHVQRALVERLTDLSDLEIEYARIINGRWEREVLLKLLSARDEDAIPLVNLRQPAGDLGIRRLDSVIQSFVKNGVLARVADAMYQFNDTRVQVYARLRAPLTDEARKRWGHYEASRVASALTPP